MSFGRQPGSSRFLRVDITPMLDVVFLLIIFFMTTAQFTRLVREDIDLPQERGEQDENADEAGLVINVAADGRLVVSGEEVDLDGLAAIVRDEIARQPGRDARQLKLMIRPDRAGDTAVLNDVLERLHGLGVGAARVATEVPR